MRGDAQYKQPDVVVRVEVAFVKNKILGKECFI